MAKHEARDRRSMWEALMRSTGLQNQVDRENATELLLLFIADSCDEVQKKRDTWGSGLLFLYAMRQG